MTQPSVRIVKDSSTTYRDTKPGDLFLFSGSLHRRGLKLRTNNGYVSLSSKACCPWAHYNVGGCMNDHSLRVSAVEIVGRLEVQP